MQNRVKQDSLFKNEITPPNDVENVSTNSVGKADKAPFCVYNHQRHAVGSVIKSSDGLDLVCTEKGSWENSR